VFDSPAATIGFAFYFLFVPGLPLAFLFARRSQNWAYVLALSPLFSIGINYFALYCLNYLGFGLKVGLSYYAVMFILITVFTFLFLVRPKRFEFVSWLVSLVHTLPATLIGILVWTHAYKGFLFQAPNQDGLNHNKWIARIVQTDSVLLSDSFVGSPLYGLGKGTGFYPMAWHSLVAIGSEVAKLAVPTASLLSVLLVWVIVLPSALNALAKHWAPDLFSLGIIAGIFVQMYPLTPGMPMSWGSMTSAIGIGLLTSALCVGIVAVDNPDRLGISGFLLAAASMFFIHTPEAASLVVLMISLIAVQRDRLSRNLKVLIASTFAISILLVGFIFSDVIFNDYDSLRSMFGAPQPIWEKAIGQFFTLDVNLTSSYMLLPLLFIVGLVWASYEMSQRWFVIGTLSLGFVYLVSGASASPLSDIRFLTAPWYASYERTLWILVPFAALVSAFPIAKLLEKKNGSFLLHTLPLQICAVLLLAQIAEEQIPTAVRQLRSGPERNALLGKDDLRVIEESKKFISTGQIAVSWGNTGSTYPYMYEQIPVTAGGEIGYTGELSKGLYYIYTNIANICGSPAARKAFVTEKVGVVYFGTNAEWGETVWTESEVRRLKGLKIVSSGEKLLATVPDLSTC
jgi:hypothetical protein